MDIEALSALLTAIRSRETERRIILFGSAAFLVSLASAVPAELDFDPTLDADLLLGSDDEAARRGLNAGTRQRQRLRCSHRFSWRLCGPPHLSRLLPTRMALASCVRRGFRWSVCLEHR